MKSYKQKTLDAQADLIRRYMKNDPPKDCPFCKMYRYRQEACCGCFMSTINYDMGCVDFKSFIGSKLMDGYTKRQRLARAEFHRKVRLILLKRPAKYVTPKGWKYLDLPKEW